jgi:uncharacterized damage-inducible protein DinB
MDKSVTERKTIHGVISPMELLEHWQGHRALTRKLIEAFPEEEFFNHSIGGMRPFSEMVMELLGIAGPGVRELATGETLQLNEHFDHGNKKANLLDLWDRATLDINTYWPQLKEDRFHDTVKIFGQYEGSIYSSILYFIDNEIHHRGQGYVYLRSLGVEPPAFWDRQ